MATTKPARKTPETKAAAATTARYEVVSPLRHDGEPYAVGDEIDLSEAQAAPLLGHTVAPKTVET